MISSNTVVVIPHVISASHESKILPDSVTIHSLSVVVSKCIVIVVSLDPVLIYVPEILCMLASMSSITTLSPESSVPLNCIVTL